MKKFKVKLVNEEIPHWYKKNKQICMWGEITNEYRICRGLRFVHTPGHGGFLVGKKFAEKILPDEFREMGVENGHHLCFEEDCLYAFVMLPLIDTGLLDGFLNGADKEKQREYAINSIRHFYPEFIQKNQELSKMHRLL